MVLSKSPLCIAVRDVKTAGGSIVSNIFDEYLPKLIARIETDEFVWEMWDL